MILDVGREIKMAMRFLDVPLLLKFGGCLSIVWTQQPAAVSYLEIQTKEDKMMVRRSGTYFLPAGICDAGEETSVSNLCTPGLACLAGLSEGSQRTSR